MSSGWECGLVLSLLFLQSAAHALRRAMGELGRPGHAAAEG